MTFALKFRLPDGTIKTEDVEAAGLQIAIEFLKMKYGIKGKDIIWK